MALFDLIGGDSPMFLTADMDFGPSDTSFIEKSFNKRMAIEHDMRKKMGAGMPSFKDPDIKADHGDKDYLASRYNNAKNKLMSVLAAAPIVQAAINSDEVKALQMEMQSALDPRNIQTAEENLKNMEQAFSKIQEKNIGTKAYVNLNNPLSIQNVVSRINPETGNFITNQEYVKKQADAAQFDDRGKLASKDYTVISYTGGEASTQIEDLMGKAGKTDWKNKAPLFKTDQSGNAVLNQAVDNKGEAAINFLMNKSSSGSSNVKQLIQASKILAENLSDEARADLISDWQNRIIGSKEFFNAIKNKDQDWLDESFATYVQDRIDRHLDVFKETSSSTEYDMNSYGQAAGYGSGSENDKFDYINNVFKGLITPDYNTNNTDPVVTTKDGTKFYRPEALKTIEIAGADGKVKQVVVPIGTIANANMDVALENINKQLKDSPVLLSSKPGSFMTQDGVIMNTNELKGAKVIRYNRYVEMPNIVNGNMTSTNSPEDKGRYWGATIFIPKDEIENYKGITYGKKGKREVANYSEEYVGEDVYLPNMDKTILTTVKNNEGSVIGYEANVLLSAGGIQESGLIQSEGTQGVKQAQEVADFNAIRRLETARQERLKKESAKNYQIK